MKKSTMIVIVAMFMACIAMIAVLDKVPVQKSARQVDFSMVGTNEEVEVAIPASVINNDGIDPETMAALEKLGLGDGFATVSVKQ